MKRIAGLFFFIFNICCVMTLPSQVPCTVDELSGIFITKDSDCEARGIYINTVVLTPIRNNITNGSFNWQFRQDSVNGVWQSLNSNWTIGPGGVISNPFFSTADNGQYRCAFREGVTLCRDIERIWVSVSPRPLVDIVADSLNCDGLWLSAVDLNNPSGAGNSWCWNPDGSSCESTARAFPFYGPGCFMVAGIVTVNVTNSFGCEELYFENGICNPEALDVVSTLNAPDTVFCSKTAEITLSRFTPVFGIPPSWEFQWQRNGVDIPGADSTSFFPTQSGTYTCRVSNSIGCTQSTAPIGVKVLPLPQAAISPQGSTEICNLSSVQLNITTPAANAVQWYRNNVLLPGTSPSFTATTGGTYKALVTGTNGCTKFSSNSRVTVYRSRITANGPVIFCAGDSVVLQNMNSNAVSWQWQRNNVNIPGANAVTYSAKTPGLYRVRTTSAAGCTSFSSSVDVNVNCREGLMPASEPELSLWPNPAGDQLFFESEGIVDPQMIMIHDTEGRLIKEQRYLSSQPLSLHDVAPGIYLLSVQGGDGQWVRRFVRE
jgi:hypothetical protein